MKRTLIGAIPFDLPDEIEAAVSGARVWDSSCSPEARVYYIERDGGLYLKISESGSLRREAELTSYFYKKALGPELISYVSGERDFMLSARMPGEDCTHADHLKEPERLSDLLAVSLRGLHEADFSDCPVQNRTAEYIETVEKRYKEGIFDPSYLLPSLGKMTADEAYGYFSALAPELGSRVLLHGDYCLPNIMLNGWRLSGFIDLGCGGVGDRHIDLFWGAWTLRYNLGTDRYRERFFDAYGRDAVNTELIGAISAAECFG